MTETQRIILGYAVITLYVLAVIFFGEFLHKKCKVEKILARKIEHILTGACWLLGYLFFGVTYHNVLINGLAFVALILITHLRLMESVEHSDGKKNYGLVFFGLSTFVVAAIGVFVFPDLYPLAGIAYYCLTLGDGLAPMVAKLFKKGNPKLIKDKSLWGCSTVFIVCTLTAAVFNACFSLGFSPLFLLSIGGLATICEAFGGKADNLAINFLVYAYLILYALGFIPESIVLMLVITPSLALLVGYKKSLTFWANLLAVIYLGLITYFLGYAGFTTVCTLFILEAVVSHFAKGIAAKNQPKGKQQPRQFKQIFANSIVCLVFAFLYYVFKRPVYEYAAYTAVLAEFCDSIASDVGKLSKKAPVDILKGKPLPVGISGGISLLGTLAAVVAAFSTTLLPFIFLPFNFKLYLWIAALAFGGTLIDSVLGSAVQALYQCPVCNHWAEKSMHCDTPAVLIKGIRIIDNSAVNLLSGIIIALISLLFVFI